MMRSRIHILGAVVLILALTLLFVFRERREQSLPENTSGAKTDSAAQIPISNSLVISNTTSASLGLVKTIGAAPAFMATNAIAKKQIANWQSGISFYGKVIDEKSNAVSGANVLFAWTETPTEGGNRTKNAISDSNGLFSLKGALGPSLNVTVSKQGYYSSQKDTNGFIYNPLMGGTFSPNPDDPVIFHLRTRTKGEVVLKTRIPSGIGQIIKLPHDGGTMTLSLVGDNQPSPLDGKLLLTYWRDMSDLRASTFDWRLALSVSNGAILGTDEEFPFLAPVEGYQTTMNINMPATNQNWPSEFVTNYYVHFSGGQYGRFIFRLAPYNGVFSIDSVINPSGSRNLESN